ncbi:ribosome production factor 2 homolog [Cyclospora cayetanensis]|uniref:Ribosome production factor 2 homolog n=1 Tax=Cyclospora cayetanensis TaxID=88456 RepID=A0A6P6S131_9EIME|nr:ribosome production factor 2 homolog [Cyclospora cayetanensis]
MGKAVKKARRREGKALSKKGGGASLSAKREGSLGSAGLTLSRKAKTRKGRQILAARESESYAGVKSLLLMRGGRCNTELQALLGDLRDLKKPHAVFLSQRKQQDLHPFEDAEPIEYLTRKNDCGLFAFASSSKKRPARLILGRVYEHEILDMHEFSVSHYTPAAAFASVQAPAAGSAPLVLLQGGLWEASEELKNAKNLFGDLFRSVGGPRDGKQQKLFLGGVDRLIAVSAVQASSATAMRAEAAAAEGERATAEGAPAAEAAVGANSAGGGYRGVLICIRHYRIALVKPQEENRAGSGPAVKLEEVGPQIDLKPDRVRLPSAEKWKAALKSLEKAKAEERREKQKAAAEEEGSNAPQGPPKKKSKNITTNVFGDSVGRVFVGTPDFGRLKQIQSPLLHKLQREEALRKKKEGNSKKQGGEEAEQQ